MISREDCMKCNRHMRGYKRNLARKQKKEFMIIAVMMFVVFGYLIWSVNRNMEDNLQTIYQPVFKDIPAETITNIEYIEDMYSYIEMGLPTGADGAFKTYMDYRKITNQSSKQWHLQQLAVTNDDGFRMFNGKYLIAVGSYYSKEVGKEFRITLADGFTFNAIVGDLKMDKHTDNNNQYMPENGNIVEFIVDVDKLDPLTKKLGDVSNSGLKGKIISIEEEVISLEKINRN